MRDIKKSSHGIEYSLVAWDRPFTVEDSISRISVKSSGIYFIAVSEVGRVLATTEKGAILGMEELIHKTLFPEYYQR